MFNFFKKKCHIDIYQPLMGSVVDISTVSDPTFAQKMMGEGVAIEPSNNVLVAPCDGQIAMVTPTKHALVIKNSNIEILLHIGLDTVELDGKGFTVNVKVNDIVKQGQPLISFDSDFILQKGKKLITPIVVINMDKVKRLEKYLTSASGIIMTIEEK